MLKSFASIPLVCCVVGVLTLTASWTAFAQRGVIEPARPDNPVSLSHLNAAKALAGTDAFLAKPYSFFCVAGNARAQNNNAPDVEPTKLFDNVYTVGNSETTVYALTSSEGILLLDAGFENKAETLASQLRTLNLDPARVKYILLGHGHADHFGGAKFFQDTYGAKVAASGADWDLISAPAAGGPAPARGGGSGAKPARDVTLVGGQPFVFGDLTIMPVAIPGHTPGSLAFIFPVKDKGTTRMAGLFGGTVLTTGILTTTALKQYTQSIAIYLESAKTMNVEVELQNHPIFDGMPERLAGLKSAGPGNSSPFVIGNDRYLAMWRIVSECIQAEIARREA
ncbi:MAG TPA: MBL fold metallo-hydrolase [Vicinamibacterales bacterium]|nr:MBL fold metallo-hydrolase [Vicinamibacterales bacterium]